MNPSIQLAIPTATVGTGVTRGRPGPGSWRAAIRGMCAVLTTVLALLAATLVSVAVDVAAPTPAHALCSGTLPGTWRNIDLNTRSVTQVTVTMTSCGDTVLCDTSGHCTQSQTRYSIRTFGKCHPTDCDMGTQPMTSRPDGWQRAVYKYSWATKAVWVKTYVYYGRTYLRVWVHTDFTAADGRTDYTSDVWMLK